MLKLYNKTGNNLIGNLDNCIECVVEEERNGIFELIMTYPVVDAIYNSLEKENIIIANANDTLKAQKFRIYNIRKYMKNQVTVYARHISFDLMHDVIEEEISFTNQSCEYALNQIFRNSISSKHFKGYSDIINAQNFKVSKVNCLSAIAGTKGSVIDTFGTGAEILRDNFNIHVLNKRGHDNSVSIEYRKNLTGLEVEEDTTDLVTRILPYATQKVGEEEKTIDYNGYVDAPNINAFSKPYSAWIDYSDKFEQDEEVTQEKLKIYAEREYTVNKRHIPKCNYKIEFIPLSKVVGYKELEDKISLCDTVTIKDTRYGIDTQAKVIKTVYNVLLGRYDSMELGEPKTTLGDVITNNGGSNNSGSNNGGTGGSDSEKVEIDDSNFPNIIPPKPVLSSNVMGFGSVEVSWTFENKSYFKYELYASKVKDFTPNSFYLIYSGQASAFLHVVEPNETWYYRVCGINSHGNRGEFSEQLTVNTTKLDDFEQYFSSLAVKNLVANMFSADYIKAGQIKGTWIDARNLTVTDGNGKRTLDIDSFGNVALDVTSLKISANNVPTFENVKDEIQNSINNYKDTVNKELDDIKDAMDNLGDTLDEAFKDGIINEAEAIAIKQQIQNLEIEKKDIDSVYNSLYSNVDLTGTAKNNLYNAKAFYNTAHTNLINAINDAIADKKISTDENTLVKRAFANYGTALATFRSKSEEALDSIANKKKQDAIQYTDTQFNILDGKIQSKITSADAQSIAEQTVNSFKHEVSNTYISKENADDSFLSKDQASSLTAGLQKNLIIGGNFKLQVFDSWDNSRKRNIEFYTTTTGLAGITVREWNYEGWIYSNHVNVKAMNSNKISFAVKMKVESNLRGAEVFLGHYGANKNLIREVWIGDASAGFEGEIGREGYTIPSDVHYVALRIDHNGLKKNTNSNVVLFLEYINLVEGDTVPHTFLQDDGISLKESYSKIEQTAEGIKQTVSKKVNSDEIISTINQTAEVVQIQASRINLDGYVFVSSQLKAPHITGSALVYIEEDGILSCDGETYATKLYITDLARDCYFSSDAPAYFNNTLLAKKGLTATDRIHAKNGISVNDGITANGNMILNGYTVIKNNSLGVESNIYCTNGTVEAKYLKVNNSGTVSGTLSVGSTLYVGGSLEVKNYGTTLAQLEVNGTTTLKGYTVIKNNSLGVEGFIYCNGNIEALQSGRGQINCNYLGSMGNIACRGTLSGSNLSISGSKNCVQETQNYGKRLVNAYETADYLFGDVGESTIENGECIVYLDDIFKEVITTDITYQVFLTKYGKGDIWVSERHSDYFVVQAENDISFGWEIKGKRKGYENYRLEEYVEEIPGGKEDVQENNAI